jgi:hypothetical protein
MLTEIDILRHIAGIEAPGDPRSRYRDGLSMTIFPTGVATTR